MQRREGWEGERGPGDSGVFPLTEQGCSQEWASSGSSHSRCILRLLFEHVHGSDPGLWGHPHQEDEDGGSVSWESLNPSGHWSPWGPQGSKQKQQWKEGLGNGSLESLLRGRNGMNLDRKADDSRCGLGLGFI